MWIGEKNVICESMNYAYDTSKMRAYSRASEGHNVILVNGEGQNRFINASWDEHTPFTVEPVLFETNDNCDTAFAIYDEGYGDKAKNTATHKRTVHFIKKPRLGTPFFIIKDEISSEKENDLTLIWHYNTDSLSITANGAYCTELTTFITAEGESVIYRGSEEPFAGWRSVSVKPPIYVPIPVLHKKIKAQNAVFYTIFVPNDGDGVCPVDRVTSVVNGILLTYKDGKTEEYSV